MNHSTPLDDRVSAASTFGLTRLVLAAEVARRHYLDDKSKIEISGELGISRFQVARLLDLARAAGLIRITIREFDTTTTCDAIRDSSEIASRDARGRSVA